MKLIYSSPFSHDLFWSADDSLVLRVLAGSPGLYEVERQLSVEDLEGYQAEGTDFVDRLALSIAKERSHFQLRLQPCPL